MGDIYFPSILWKEHHPIILNSVHNSDLNEFVCGYNAHALSNVHKTTVSASDVLDSLTLSDPGYFRQLTIRGGGALKPPPPLRSRKLLCQSSPYHTCEFSQVFLA